MSFICYMLKVKNIEFSFVYWREGPQGNTALLW